MIHKDIVIARAVSDWICLGPWSMDAGQLQLTIEALETYVRVSQVAIDKANDELQRDETGEQSPAWDALERHQEIKYNAQDAIKVLRDCLSKQS